MIVNDIANCQFRPVLSLNDFFILTITYAKNVLQKRVSYGLDKVMYTIQVEG